MSRSYKKNPYVTDHKRGSSKKAKRQANHSFRRKIAQDNNMPARAQKNKITDSYMICDYRWRMTYDQAVEWYKYHSETEASAYFKKHYPTLESWLKYWKKCYVRK